MRVRDHFYIWWSNLLAWEYETIFHLMEVPTMTLPNVKILLRWPSRMQILEQFDGTIEWKVTERSEGASPQRLSEARKRPPQRLSEAREHPPSD